MTWVEEIYLYDLAYDLGSDEYYNDVDIFRGVRDTVIDRLKAASWYADDDLDLVDIVKRLEGAKDADEFDDIWMREFWIWSEDNWVHVKSEGGEA